MTNANPYTQQKKESGRVLVGLSGGVHSAVTAALLRTQGYEVMGLHLSMGCDVTEPLWQALSLMGSRCCEGGAAERAEQQAARIGISFQRVDVHEAYEAYVIDEMAHKTLQGELPNPCVSCYRRVKVDALFKKAQELRCDWVATGHGAQVQVDPLTGTAHLMQASDPQRDQSYFLFELPQEQLQRMLLPLGNFPRSMVNKLAAEFDLTTDGPQQARELCYVSSPAFSTLLETRIPLGLRKKGTIHAPGDKPLCEHQGLFRYQIGKSPGDLDQVVLSRQEIEPLVVVSKDVSTGILRLGDPRTLRADHCVARNCHWTRPLNELGSLKCIARVSPKDELGVPCLLTLFENQTAQAQFERPHGPMIPGQVIAFYQEGELLGGGWI